MISFLTLVFPFALAWFVKDQLDKKEKRMIDREEIFQKWVFESLYVMNKQVRLPDAPIESEQKIPAVVYSPTEDPMNEINGTMDDFYEQ